MTQPAASTPETVTVRVPAKVNVQLSVGGVRPDGFHGLANVFLAVGLYDSVSATRAEAPLLTVSGPDAALVPQDRSNLAARAAALLAARHGLAADVHLHIAKDIPVAGGMAGGSADAAGALLACDRLWGLHSPREELLELCAELGSDVPFSFAGGAALGGGPGRGADPAGGRRRLPLGVRGRGRRAVDPGRLPGVRPAAGGRRDGFLGRRRPRTGRLPGTAGGAARGRRRGAGRGPAQRSPAGRALAAPPSLAETLETGLAAGALAALVSGSGPTCAFLVADPDSATRVAHALTASGTCRGARATTGPAPGAGLV